MNQNTRNIVIIVVAMLIVLVGLTGFLFLINDDQGSGPFENDLEVTWTTNATGKYQLNVYGFTNLTKKELLNWEIYEIEVQALNKNGDILGKSIDTHSEYTNVHNGKVYFPQVTVNSKEDVDKILVLICYDNGIVGSIEKKL
jgi:hypothetical protein